MQEIKKERNDRLINELLNVWESSVRATHKFLSNEEILKIKKYVPVAIKEVNHLIVEFAENNKPIAFMGIENSKLEMLFVAAEYRGMGIGKKMLLYGIEKYGVNDLAVNEDNPNAKDFYEHMGFVVYERHELDDQGKPYPVLYMKLER